MLTLNAIVLNDKCLNTRLIKCQISGKHSRKITTEIANLSTIKKKKVKIIKDRSILYISIRGINSNLSIPLLCNNSFTTVSLDA